LNNISSENETKKVSNITILATYTIFSVVLAAETVIMGWETWAIPLIVIGLLFGWFIHITRLFAGKYRLWIHATLMLVSFFFYGIHTTSTFDLVGIAALLMLLFSMTGSAVFVNLTLVSYYITIVYDLLIMAGSGELTADPLTITRIFLHLFLIFVFARITLLILDSAKKEREEYSEIIENLEDTNRRTEDFLTNVSHEFRTPINAVTGITSIIIKKVHDKEIREQITSVQQAGYRLFEQVGAILDYTEIDTGRMSLSNDVYMISSIINDIVTENYQIWHSSGCEIIFDVDADIPAQLSGDGGAIKKILKNLIANAVKFTKEGGVYVHIYCFEKDYGVNLCLEIADTGIGMDSSELNRIRERFYQINSGRTRRAGGLGLGLPIVYGLTKAMGGFLHMKSEVGSGSTVHVSVPQQVADASPSMSVANRDDICIAVFIRFERISDPRVREYYETMTENMVARLYLVKRNVSSMDEFEKVQRIYKVTHLFVGEEEYEEEKDRLEALDNSISVFVVADEGFALPLKSRARILRKPFYSFTLAGVLNADSSDEADDHSGKRMVTPGVSALVVDDEAMNLMVAEGIFKDYGMKVKTVFSGFEAIKACENEHFDIIFLDHMMPEMDGIETLKHLRNLQKSKGELSAMVALTANAVSGAKEMFLSEGFDGFVAKPIEYSELERVLRKVLPRSSVDYIEGDIIFDENTESSVISGKEADPFEAMRSKGINTADGIRYCRNDKEFYMDILKSFVSDSASKQDGIITALENGDIESYRIQVHALKSTSKMIGAASLSDFARQMEEAAKKKDVPYIQSHQDDLMNMYDNVLDIITASIGFKSDSAKKELLDIERDELLSKLTELKATISTYEQERADSIIEELSGYRLGDTVLSEALSNIRSSIDDFDMQSALSETEGLIEDIGGAAK